MSATHARREAAVLEVLRPNLEADGFHVFVEPSRMVLPPFLHAHRPDAIAVKDGQKIAIEVVVGEQTRDDNLQSMRELFKPHPDWELRVIYAPPGSMVTDMQVMSPELLMHYLGRIPDILDKSGPIAALLTAWSVFEAAARSVLPNDLSRPQTPARLLEILASDGSVTPDEADELRRLGRLRDEAAHGRLDIALTRDELDALVRTTRMILQEAAPSRV